MLLRNAGRIVHVYCEEAVSASDRRFLQVMANSVLDRS